MKKIAFNYINTLKYNYWYNISDIPRYIFNDVINIIDSVDYFRELSLSGKIIEFNDFYDKFIIYNHPSFEIRM